MIQWKHEFAHWGDWYECRVIPGPCTWLVLSYDLVPNTHLSLPLGPDMYLVDDL